MRISDLLIGQLRIVDADLIIPALDHPAFAGDPDLPPREFARAWFWSMRSADLLIEAMHRLAIGDREWIWEIANLAPPDDTHIRRLAAVYAASRSVTEAAAHAAQIAVTESVYSFCAEHDAPLARLHDYYRAAYAATYSAIDEIALHQAHTVYFWADKKDYVALERLISLIDTRLAEAEEVSNE